MLSSKESGYQRYCTYSVPANSLDSCAELSGDARVTVLLVASTDRIWWMSMDSRPSPTASHVRLGLPLASVSMNFVTSDRCRTVAPFTAGVVRLGSVIWYGRTEC